MIRKLRVVTIYSMAYLLAVAPRAVVPQNVPATSIYYERQTTTEINGQDLHTISTSTTKVWRKGSFLRIESPAMPGSQKKITVRRDGYIYYLNPEDKSATRLTQPEPASPASGVEQTGDLKEYVKTLAKNGAQVTGTRRIGSEDTNEYTIPTRNTSAVHTSSVHKLWVSVASQMPVMETIESPNVKTTILYQNVQIGQELPDELFAIPPDFKTVDVGKQPRTIPAQPPVPKK